MVNVTLSSMLRAALLGTVLLCVPLGIGPALAHNTLEDSSPADGSVLWESPPTWSLRFSGSVPLDSASGQIIDASGVRTSLGAPVHGDSTNVIVFALPGELAGNVTARWRLVGVDGHVISGRVNFEVKAEDPFSSSEATPSSGVVDVPESTAAPSDADDSRPLPRSVSYVVRILDFVLLIGVIGLVVVELRIAGGVSSTLNGARLVRFGPPALIATGAIQALVLAAEIGGTTLLDSLGQVGTAFSTTPGAMAFMQPLLAGVLAVQLRGTPWQQSRAGTSMLVGTMTLLLLARAYSGHPRSEGIAVLGIPLDMVHNAAAGVWLGGLVVLLFCVVSVVDESRAVQAFRTFGRYATVAVAALLTTGVAQVANMHSGVESIVTTSHGRTLLLKIAFVVGMLTIGNMNRRRVANLVQVSAADSASVRQVVRASLVEAALGAAALATTAALVVSSFA